MLLNEVWLMDVYRCEHVMDLFSVKETKAREIIKQLNNELKEKGYITVAGRVPIEYFHERTKIPKNNHELR
ncbi:hypothetical protein XO28_0030 [Bacillus phage phi4J1]|uniref:Uncharacterized protein n=3 Tax=root TaxID=1 RepID=A0A0S2MV91_9CAUD|nr:hypothetical protein XO28_0030 [Bacillus phage phi4J1]ALO79841.1 hypothetical protein XO28_0030 [Bacillus phage phi4J1]